MKERGFREVVDSPRQEPVEPLTPIEQKMVETMNDFTRRNTGHAPWEKLVAEARRQLLAAASIEEQARAEAKAAKRR